MPPDSHTRDSADSLPGRRILLLSAYDAASHRQWRLNLQTLFPHCRWTQLSLPPRHFRWRLRGNSLTWSFNQQATLTADYDLLVVTSMVDLAGLRALHPALASIPTVAYFHENQFVYPLNPRNDHQQSGVEPQIQSLFTALCADRVVFNSHYNRSTFLTGVRSLMKRLPDHVPKGMLEQLERADVIPVPLDPNLMRFRSKALQAPLQAALQATEGVLEIIWNHRWEYDKGPALLQAIVNELIGKRTPFRLHLLGQRFRKQPAEFENILRQSADHCEALGIQPAANVWIEDREDYYRFLDRADIVLSTALHDFQGLSLLEGIALGCTPLAPDRLVYPEYLPAEFRYSGDGQEQEALAAAAKLDHWARTKAQGEVLPLPPRAHQFTAAALKESYSALLLSGNTTA